MAALTPRIVNRIRRGIRRLSGRRVGHLVPVSTANAEQVASRYPGVSAVVRDVDDGPSSLAPRHLPDDHLTSHQIFDRRSESIVLDIRDPDFFFCNNVLHDPDLNVVFGDDTASEQEVLEGRPYAARSIAKRSGTIAYLTNTWAANYYHWMQLTLPLLECYATLAPSIRPDFYYVGEGALLPFQRETLARAGIRPEQIVTEPCRADRILMAIKINRRQHGTRYRDRIGHDYVRSLFAGELFSRKAERIYVQRGNVSRRRFANEAGLALLLRNYGFRAVSMDGLKVADQARLFAGASAIVAPHGAALTNLLFAQPATRVIEIFPRGYEEASYFAAATHGEFDYYYMIDDSGGDDFSKVERVLSLAGIGPQTA